MKPVKIGSLTHSLGMLERGDSLWRTVDPQRVQAAMNEVSARQSRAPTLAGRQFVQELHIAVPVNPKNPSKHALLRVTRIR